MLIQQRVDKYSLVNLKNWPKSIKLRTAHSFSYFAFYWSNCIILFEVAIVRFSKERTSLAKMSDGK